MVVFVEWEEDEIEPPQLHGGRLVWKDGAPPRSAAALDRTARTDGPVDVATLEARRPPPVAVVPRRNPVIEALGCYPIVMAVAASIDLNTLDNLSRTCRGVRHALLQYRSILLVSTLHCTNEPLPIDPEETLRYRARAGNWFYMEDTGRTSYNGKSGQCARDLVAECRRCGTVVCRNCTIKPPAPIVQRDRHRRLCLACTRAPLGCLVKPRLPPDVPLDSEAMQRAICRCATEGVWLCQPCGRTIRGDDSDYRGIWRWRMQYGEVLGGLGTGIGEGDRGVICGREAECLAAREREQETDCDAADAREADGFLQLLGGGSSPPAGSSIATTATPAGSSVGSVSSVHSLASVASSTLSAAAAAAAAVGGGGGGGLAGNNNNTNNDISSGSNNSSNSVGGSESRRTPSPAMLGPGYARHEIEGIGGVVKTKLVQMVRVGACVPEWEDEKASGLILGREADGRVRSWCGWCWRVIPGKKDYEAAAGKR